MGRPRRRRPRRSELVSLAERLAALRILRIAFASIALGVAASGSARSRPSVAALCLITGVYLAVSAAVDAVHRLMGTRALRLVGVALLLDAVYLAWIVYATGGTQSPLRFLVYAHIVAITLLGSYRTGIKMAAWYSLLVLAASYAQAAGLLPIREGTPAALPGGPGFSRASMLTIGALWTVTLVAAACSAVNERELRGQKVDLEQLSEVVAAFDRSASGSEIPRILVDELCRVFGFTRGVVLVARSEEADLAVAAAHGVEDVDASDPGVDPLMVRAWHQRSTQLVRRIDPRTDPRLSTALPGGRNILVVPMFFDGGHRMGIVALEWPGREGIKRWMLALVEQFTAHGARALHNAWLVEEIRARLEENRALQAELQEQNLVLETRVRERTRELSESVDELRAVDAARRTLLSRLVNAEEEERRRIAGDVHDGPVQQLVAASLALQIVGKTIAGDVAQPVVDRVEDVVSTLNEAVGGMRSLIFELRPLALDHEGLAPALRQLGDRLAPETACRVTDRLDREPPGDTRAILYRIAQEALANIRKHAHARLVEISLEADEGGYLIRIRDDGVGFLPPGRLHSIPGHLGLSSMRERAEMARGTCQITSDPGQGTLVEVWLPEELGAEAVPEVLRLSSERAAS
jgi:signal transduction histidine kinase